MTGLAIAADATPFLATLAALAGLLFLAAVWLNRWPLWMAGWGCVLLSLAVAFFFRDPPRTGARDPDAFLAPADGRVVAIDTLPAPAYLEGPAVRVAIYLSLMDVHVQRSPVDGVVDYVARQPGRFAPAWSEEAGENEAAVMGISTGEVRILVRQVAGTVARRIVTYVEEGERVDQAERIGLIRFGSRVEAYLPAGTGLEVAVGDRVRAGESVLGRVPETVGPTPMDRVAGGSGTRPVPAGVAATVAAGIAEAAGSPVGGGS